MLKLFRIATAEVFNAGYGLLNFDLLVFFILGFGWKTLPRERASDEIHEHDSNLLEVISPSLFYTKMCIEGSITSSACKRLIVLKGNVAT